MLNDLKLGWHFVREVLARDYEYERVPEPDLIMENPDNVREYRDAGLVTGNGSSVYLFNMLLLSGAIKPGSTIVDLACGPANLLIELATMHPEASFIGIDLSAEMLACAEDLRAKAGANNVQFIVGDITRLDMLADQSADTVMSTLSLHHLPEASMLAQCFREIGRVLRPGGDVHLMDFASLKRVATTQYFVRDRTAGLGEFLTRDYENSLKAAFRVGDFASLLPLLGDAPSKLRLHKTFGVPFMVVLTSLTGCKPDQVRRLQLSQYLNRMHASQRRDFEALRLFFRLDGLSVFSPKQSSMET